MRLLYAVYVAVIGVERTVQQYCRTALRGTPQKVPTPHTRISAKIYPRESGKVPIPMLRDTPSVVGAGVIKPRPTTPIGGRGRLYAIPKGMHGGAPSVMHQACAASHLR